MLCICLGSISLFGHFIWSQSALKYSKYSHYPKEKETASKHSEHFVRDFQILVGMVGDYQIMDCPFFPQSPRWVVTNPSVCVDVTANYWF